MPFYQSDSNLTTAAAKALAATQTEFPDLKDEQIARYTRFGRGPSWFFFSLGVPAFACDSPGMWPLTQGDILIFENALEPLVKN